MPAPGVWGSTPGGVAIASVKICVRQNENSSSHFLHLLSLAINTGRKKQLRKWKEKPPPLKRRQMEGGKTEDVRQIYCGPNRS
jgi:hypothetical protein